MMNTGTQEKLLYRYLLGELPEAEQTALEEEFFRDDEKFEQVWAAENDLVDRYVRGRLTHSERASFERHYLPAPHHRERVAAARLLLSAADAAAAPVSVAASPAASWWASLKEFFRVPSFAFGAAAALLLLCGAAWLFSERTRLNNQLAQLSSERAAQQQRAQELARQKQELEQQLATRNERDAQLEAELARLRAEQRAQITPPPAQPTVFSFLLTPFVRDEEMRALTIPPAARQVRLQMKLENNDYRSYQASLRAVDGAQVWRQVIGKTRPAKIVAVNVPTSSLTAGDYILTLSGRRAAGETEELNRYYFRVVKKMATVK